MPSEYDALLESTPAQQKSEYDALLPSAQPKSSVLGEIGTAIKNTAVGFVKGLARPPSLAEIALPIFGGQIERQYEHAKAAEQAIRGGQPAAQSIAQAYAPNVSELASSEATRGQKIQAGVNIAAEVAPFLIPGLRGVKNYGVAGRSLMDIVTGAKPEPLAAETAAAEQIQKGGEISATQERVVKEGNIPKYPRDDTGRASTETGGRSGDVAGAKVEAPQAPQVAPAVPQPEQAISGQEISTLLTESGLNEAVKNKVQRTLQQFTPNSEVRFTSPRGESLVSRDPATGKWRVTEFAYDEKGTLSPQRHDLFDTWEQAVSDEASNLNTKAIGGGELRPQNLTAKSVEDTTTSEKTVGLSKFGGGVTDRITSEATGISRRASPPESPPVSEGGAGIQAPISKEIKGKTPTESATVTTGTGEAPISGIAVRDNRTGQIFTGAKSDTHGDLIVRHFKEAPNASAKSGDVTSGWVDTEGNFLDNKQAWRRVNISNQVQGKIAKKTPELRASDVQTGRVNLAAPVPKAEGAPVSQPTETTPAVTEPTMAAPVAETAIKVGDTVRFTEPSIAYKEGQPITIQNKKVGRVTLLRDDGKIEVKSQDGGYHVFTPQELGQERTQVETVASNAQSNAQGNARQVGARFIASPEHAAKIEQARQKFRDAINKTDYASPKDRAGAIFAAREKVEQAVADAHVGKPLKESVEPAPPVSEAQPATTAQPLTQTKGGVSEEVQKAQDEGQGRQGVLAPEAATVQPPAAPPETPEELGQALKEPPKLAGVSNRVLQERYARGEIPQAPESGKGVLKEDLVRRANEIYSPERVQVAAEKVMRGEANLDDHALVTLQEEKLTKIASDAERAMKSNPNDPALRQAYDEAVANQQQWEHEVVPPMKLLAHNQMINLQGATNVDTGTLVGLQKLAWDTGKGDFTPEQKPIMNEAANRVAAAESAEKAAIIKANETVQKILKPSRYLNLNQLRESLNETLKTMTCG